MKILFDHNLPRKLHQHFPPHEISFTKKFGWEQFNNGVLLGLAQSEFDVLLTVDSNIYHQQNVARFDIAVIVMRAWDNSYESLFPLLPEVMEMLEEISPGEIRYIYADESLRERDQRRGKGPFA